MRDRAIPLDRAFRAAQELRAFLLVNFRQVLDEFDREGSEAVLIGKVLPRDPNDLLEVFAEFLASSCWLLSAVVGELPAAMPSERLNHTCTLPPRWNISTGTPRASQTVLMRWRPVP